jgi:hypothetical protein
MVISAATRFISAKRARSSQNTGGSHRATFTEPRQSRVRARPTPRDQMIRAPIRAVLPAHFAKPEVPPVMTTVLPFTSNLAGEAYSGLQSGLVMPS